MAELLGTGASGPDVYGIESSGLGFLNEFRRFRANFASEIPSSSGHGRRHNVDNKLLAMAYRADIGLLYYRTDLLRGYGYRATQDMG